MLLGILGMGLVHLLFAIGVGAAVGERVGKWTGHNPRIFAGVGAGLGLATLILAYAFQPEPEPPVHYPLATAPSASTAPAPASSTSSAVAAALDGPTDPAWGQDGFAGAEVAGDAAVDDVEAAWGEADAGAREDPAGSPGDLAPFDETLTDEASTGSWGARVASARAAGSGQSDPAETGQERGLVEALSQE
jgi:hypothetical protein